MAFGFLKRLSGDPSEAALRKAKPLLKRINDLGEEYKKLKVSELKAKTAEFKERFEKGETLDDLLPEAFATVREAADRVIKERHFDVQLMGGIALHNGNFAEMKTGEGKTLTATLPVYLNALAGKGVHVVTVNEYLARRDTEWMGQVYTYLGLTVGNLYHDQPKEEKKEAYAADITYGTNNEFGFDYLRDNMVSSLDEVVQRGRAFAIVDEVDSILIDEARTPLIISGPAEGTSELYKRFATLVPRLKKDEDYTVDEKRRSAVLTDDGIKQMEQFLNIDNIYEAGGLRLVHHLEQALQAHALFHKDKEYVVNEGEVVIVDEFTGRMMPGRRFSEGLHQAIEAKEGVEIKQETRTMATITFQNYFRLYDKLAGMTGTAVTEREEFRKIYSIDVVEIPTHRPMIRQDNNDVIYKHEPAKFNAIVQEIKERAEKGQPVLLGTIAVEKSEVLSKLLTAAGVKHEVLNAKNHEREAEIIADAGQKSAVTVSTNMAGRGTDIKLGEGVEELGGLHVIGSERHEARRIDNQLRGRAGRQGDPGSSQFYVSLEDDLMRVFGGDRIKGVMERLKLPDDQPIKAGIISKSIESAQKRVEGHNFDIRKHVVEYDDVMNAHREVIYTRRRKILEHENLRDDILEMYGAEVHLVVSLHTQSEDPNEWELDKIAEHMRALVTVEGNLEEQLKSVKEREGLIEGLKQMIERAYQAKEEVQGEENMRTLERLVYLRTIDTLWVDHLDAMESLREGVGLRGYGQKDPLTEYKAEAFNMFEGLLGAIQTEVTRTLFKVELNVEQQQGPTEVEQAAKNVSTAKGADKKPGGKAKIGKEEPGEEPVEATPAKPAKKAKKDAKKERKAAKAEKKPEKKAEPKPEPKAEPKPEPKPEPEPEAKPTPEPEPQPEPQPAPSVDAAQAEALASTPSVSETKKEGSTTITVKSREAGTPPASQTPAGASTDKVGRNEPCPCGSGLKYKKCGLINAPQHRG